MGVKFPHTFKTMLYKAKQRHNIPSLKGQEHYDAQSIEEQMLIASTANQPIEHVSPVIYTPRKDGVRPEYDIRTDRFEIAQEAMDKVSGSYKARREEAMKQVEKPTGTETKTE